MYKNRDSLLMLFIQRRLKKQYPFSDIQKKESVSHKNRGERKSEELKSKSEDLERGVDAVG